ncbi:hypothetical protein D3C87_1724210 [compost metagenome]
MCQQHGGLAVLIERRVELVEANRGEFIAHPRITGNGTGLFSVKTIRTGIGIGPGIRRADGTDVKADHARIADNGFG